MIINIFTFQNTEQQEATLNSSLKIRVCSSEELWLTTLNDFCVWKSMPQISSWHLYELHLPKISLKAFHPCKHNPSGYNAGLFQFPLGHLLLSQGRSFLQLFQCQGCSRLHIPVNSSHTSLESLQGESSAGLSQISHCLSSSFQGRNALHLQLQLCLEKLPILGLFIRSVLLIKDTGKRGRKSTMQKSCRAERTEEKETSFQDV